MSAHVRKPRTGVNTSVKWTYNLFRSMIARKANWATCGYTDEQEGSFPQDSRNRQGVQERTPNINDQS